MTHNNALRRLAIVGRLRSPGLTDPCHAQSMADEFAGWAKPPDWQEPPTGDPATRVSRALKAALFGFLVFPVALHVWSLWLLSTVSYSALEPRSRRKYWMALGIDVLALLAIGTLIYLALTHQLSL